jgi:hypothetical protein
MSTSADITPANAFYRELILRNGGLISTRAQHTLSGITVLIAGCGSTGGAAVESLTRLGVQRLRLADNGVFELNNLNRQSAGTADIGRNKAVVAAERAHKINPYLHATVETSGIRSSTVTTLVEKVDVVIDGVDVTEPAGWRAKLLLHQSAAAARIPVISGYDMAGLQYVRFYDYRAASGRAFDGRIDDADLDAKTIWALLMRVIPLRYVPLETIRDVRAHIGDQDYCVPQLVYASMLFGALGGRIVVDLCEGHPIRTHTVIDIHAAPRPTGRRIAMRVAKSVELLKAARDIPRLRRRST